MKRWVITLTAGAGCSQKYPPTVWLFKRKADAVRFLRKKIKHYLKSEWERWETYHRGWRPNHITIKDFLQTYCIENFDTNEGEFWLEQVVFENE